VLDGFFDAEGGLPCQIDGDSSALAPDWRIGAAYGLRRSICRCSAGRGSGKRKNVRVGLTHNLGGTPAHNVAAVGIFGRYGA